MFEGLEKIPMCSRWPGSDGVYLRIGYARRLSQPDIKDLLNSKMPNSHMCISQVHLFTVTVTELVSC